MNQSECARCLCQEADQTPHHVLIDCPLWRDLAWADGATLAKQLWGSADERKTPRTSASMSDVKTAETNASAKKGAKSYRLKRKPEYKHLLVFRVHALGGREV
jgi:hypothetical protein